MPATTRERRPNILTILADDLGIGDVPAYSPAATVPMPAVDALAAGGVRFTDFHTAPLCAPSRYVLLSGNYQHRGRSWSGTWNLGDGSQFRRGQRSLAQALAAAGYKTAIFGKWGIGANVSAPHRSCSYNCAVSWVLSNQSDHRIRGGPSALGFGTSFISPSGIQMPPYAYWEGPNLVGEARDAMCWPAGARPNANGVSISGIADNSFGHRTRRSVDVCGGGPNGMPYWASNNYDINMTSRALSFLESRHAARRTDGAPFFLHVCTAAVHEPHTPPRVAFGVTVAGTTPTPFTDMLASLDLTVGQLLAKLKALHELKHTIVAFMSDNGGLCQGSLAVSQGQCARDSSGGLRGHKGELYEGGHRVPLLIRWDGGPVARGAVRSQLVGLSDIYATLLDLVDAPPPAAGQAVDSVSFKQLLLPEGARAPAGRDTWCVLDASSRASNATVSAQPLRRNRRRLRAADPPRWAIRKEHWKLIGRSNAKGAPVAEELYHLGEDLAESTNLLRSSSRRRSDAAAVVDFGLSFARMLTAKEFDELAERFAHRTATHSPSWAWVAPMSDDGPFPPGAGFLRSAFIPVPQAATLPPGCDTARNDDPVLLLDEGADGVCDTGCLASPLPTHRLELHVVHSSSYGVPVLLLQGYGDNGEPWAPEAVRAHLARCGRAGLELLPLDMVSQMEHPVLRVPFCCVHPCRTADLMSRLMGAELGSGGGGRIDYLSAWWSVLAPAVGVRSSSALALEGLLELASA